MKLLTMATALLVLNITNAYAHESNKNAQSTIKQQNEKLEIEWVEPTSFTDVRSANISNAKYRKRVFSQLASHLSELASQLPEGQRLSMSVTNLDLAGRVEPSSKLGLSAGMTDIRVIRDIDIPRMSFSFTIVDASGEVIKQDNVKLKDMRFRFGVNSIHEQKPFYYEKNMLTKWFNDLSVDQNT